MRDPARIDRILGLLREAWMDCPDLRLGQLVINLVRDQTPPFYVEDDKMEASLLRWLEDRKQK